MNKKKPILIYALTVILTITLTSLLNGIEKISKEEIIKTDEEWNDIYLNYDIDSSYYEVLNAKVGDNLTIDVYLGLWCPDSKNNVPKFIRIVELIRHPNFKVNYYTVERKASPDVKYYVEKFKVERVPTFIFYRDGKEIGRIVENPQRSMEDDFIEIIF